MQGTVYSSPESALLAARAGSPAAWGSLLQRSVPYLLFLTRRQLGSLLRGKVDAEDLVQESLLQAYRKRRDFVGATEGELLAWLRGILASRLANLRRHYFGTQRRNVRRECAITADLERPSVLSAAGLVAPGGSPSEQAVRHEDAACLAEALGRLPPHYREVVVLRHVERLEFAEVARRMGRTVPSVKCLWARTLATLQTTLGEAL